MGIDRKTIRIDGISVPRALNIEDGQEYYQVFSGQQYAQSGGNLERLCGALDQAEVRWLLDVYVKNDGEIDPNVKALWLRKSDTDGRQYGTIE